MDPRRAATERNMLPTVGGAFLRSGDEVLFRFVIDSGNVVGPRPATRADQEKHPEAWRAFCAAEGVSALDRDASGGDGGSLSAEEPSVAVEAPVRVPPEFDEAQAAAEPKPKRPYTRRKKG